MKNIKQLIQFIKNQVPRLHKAILERHGLKLKQIFLWVLTLSVASSLCNFLVSGMLAPRVLFTLQFLHSIPIAPIYALVFFYGSGFLFLTWIQYEQKKEVNSEEWWEFYFLCYLPLQLGGLLTSILTFILGPSLNPLFTLLYFSLALYLIYVGTKARFLTTEKQHQMLKGVIVILGVLFLVSQIGIMGTANYSTIETTQKKAKYEWSVEFPTETEEKLRALYGDDKTKEKAVIQYARSLWNFLDYQQDSKTKLNDLNRASVCMSNRFGDENTIEEMRKVKAVILWNTELTKRFFEMDQKYSGFYEIPEDAGACDP